MHRERFNVWRGEECGFSSHARIMGKDWTNHLSPAHFFFRFIFNSKRFAPRVPIPLFQAKDQLKVAQRAEMTGQVFPDELRVLSFPSSV